MESRRHLLIAGTGRAGTSALVRYLNGLGLETHLSKPGGSLDWHEMAQAGFEDRPLSTSGDDLPYVIKLPWAYQIIDQILSDPKIKLDAVLIPTRELVEAAASRSVVELQAMNRGTGWLSEVATPWEHWATTPGGAIFSLSPVDQARLLAVGFHHLIERIVRADVPVVLLSFPRLVTDSDYLFSKVRNLLPARISYARAREVHAATFDFELVRTGLELRNDARAVAEPSGFVESGIAALNTIALKRELKRLRRELEILHRRDSRRITRRAARVAGRETTRFSIHVIDASRAGREMQKT
jgi:hypothetical protein